MKIKYCYRVAKQKEKRQYRIIKRDQLAIWMAKEGKV